MFNVGVIWEKSIDDLRIQLDPQIFSAWIKPLQVERASEASIENAEKSPELHVLTPNKFCCEHVEKNYGSLLTDLVSKNSGVEKVRLTFRVGAKLAGNNSAASSTTSNLSHASGAIQAHIEKIGRPSRANQSEKSSPKNIGRTSFEGSNLNQNYNFSNFVIGGCNQFAHAVSLRVAQNLGGQYNPLFIYGGVGLGKTHLVNAIGNAVRRQGKQVLLVSSEEFVNELITSLRSNSMMQFKKKYRSLDLLIIDDVQFIIGKDRTQEEFFHTFNELHQRGKQIILTSDTVPKDLVGLEERLRTRFASGVSADLQTPDFETRVAIIAKKAEGAKINVPEEVCRLLAEQIDSNVRELEGALNRIQAASSIQNQPITLELASDALRSITGERFFDVSTESVQRLVAEKFNVSLVDIVGKRRTQNIASARHVAMFLCRKLTGCSFPEIGALFGGRDHSTVIHACRTITERLITDRNLQDDIRTIEKKLKR